MLAKKAERLNFSSIKNRTEYPDFLDIQIKSFQDFFQLETKSEERGDEGSVQHLHGKFSNHRYT